jgi:hypothetical protein
LNDHPESRFAGLAAYLNVSTNRPISWELTITWNILLNALTQSQNNSWGRPYYSYFVDEVPEAYRLNELSKVMQSV